MFVESWVTRWDKGDGYLLLNKLPSLGNTPPKIFANGFVGVFGKSSDVGDKKF